MVIFKSRIYSGIVVVVMSSIIFGSCHRQVPDRRIISHSEAQVTLMLEEINLHTQMGQQSEAFSPRTIDAGGNLVMVKPGDWTSGFFPGILWYLYELTGNEEWQTQARLYTNNIEHEKTNAVTHDMGFKIYCSFGNSYRLTGDTRSRKVIIESAYTLAKRFSPVVGCIRSWDHNRSKYSFPVIIDNMMNLELLFAASKLTGDPSFRQIAIRHANTTLRDHFRHDYSTYHVVDYDPSTGDIVKKKTHQGLGDESTWSRGEAWALYGFTLCYRETNDIKYLNQAEKIASFILNHPNLPEDLVPYWDYDAPGIPDEPRDVSAASIMASAFYELSTYSSNAALYKEKADKIVKSLACNYMTEKGSAKGFILKHSAGSVPSKKEVDVPLIYSDYYFLEALIRARRLERNKPVV